jgi:hypothetical protein
VLLGKGNGTFQPPRTTPLDAPAVILIGDYNDDLQTDVQGLIPGAHSEARAHH